MNGYERKLTINKLLNMSVGWKSRLIGYMSFHVEQDLPQGRCKTHYIS